MQPAGLAGHGCEGYHAVAPVDVQIIGDGAQFMGRVQLPVSVQKMALQCYVIEGAYPEGLEYLQENYGLTVNTEEYLIIYTPYAENLPPEVKVIYRGS